jgi:succinate dehydrogenase / fumarate reductase cytochrome b subunit
MDLSPRMFKWLFGRNSEFWPTNMKTGMWAWIGHRLTGIILVVYIFMHLSFITTASLGDGEKSFDSLMAITSQPLFVAMDFLLVFVVIYHAMNGLRVILFDFCIGIRRQKLVFWIMMAIAAVMTVAGLWAVWHLIFPGGAA